MYLPTVLSIAGSDSGGGAGIQADIKAISALGCHATTAITAVTAQNNFEVRSFKIVDLELIQDQMEAIFSDFDVQAVKLGMLGQTAVVKLVAKLLEQYSPPHIVLDPVLAATSGNALGEKSVVDSMAEYLFPLATVITPNLEEAGIFLKQEIVSDPDQMLDVATSLIHMGARAVLLKGGHLCASHADLLDLLVLKDKEAIQSYRFVHPRIDTPNTRGTGCTLASAIAACLAHGKSLPESVSTAINYLEGVLMYRKDSTLGKGSCLGLN